MAYSPLASGVLARPERDAADAQSVVARIASELGCEPAAVALAWLREHGLISVIGPRTAEQLVANVAAAELELAHEHVAQLDAASAQPRGYPYELLEETRKRAGIASARGGFVL